MQLRPHQTKAVKAMLRNTKGQIIIPTGGGKTMCMIDDAMNEFSRTVLSKTIVVVAPRILLANQLSAEFLYHNLDGAAEPNVTVNVMHVHSGETHHFSTTKVDEIRQFNYDGTACDQKHLLIFTTYHSLHKIQESVILLLILSILMRHIIQFKRIFSLLLNTSLILLKDVITSLLHQSIVVHLSRRV